MKALKRAAALGAAILLWIPVLAGCGKKTEEISAAMEKVEAFDYAGGMAALDEAEQKGDDPQLIARARGIASIGQADYEGAIGYFEEALSYADGKVTNVELDVSKYLTVAQYKAGRIDDAIDTCTAILGMEDKDSDMYCLRGTLRLEKDLYDEAVRDFNSAVDNDKKDPDLYIRIYETMKQYGYEEQGQDYLDQAIHLNLKLTDLQKGKLYYCQGEYDSAKTALEKARDDENSDVILYLGRTYEALGDKNYAADLYKTYLAKNPEEASVWNQLGTCQMDAEDYEGALSSFAQGIQVGEGDVLQSLRFNQIVAYEYQTDFQQASVLMKTYLQNYPDDAAAKREYEFLKTR